MFWHVRLKSDNYLLMAVIRFPFDGIDSDDETGNVCIVQYSGEGKLSPKF